MSAQSLLGRIHDAVAIYCVTNARAEAAAEAVLVVVGERDAEIRQHLDGINAALITGEYGQIDRHAKAIRDQIDNAHTWYLGATRMRAVPDPVPPPEKRYGGGHVDPEDYWPQPKEMPA